MMKSLRGHRDNIFFLLVSMSKKKKAVGFFLSKNNKDHHSIFYEMPNRDLLEDKNYFIDGKTFNKFSNQVNILLKKDVPNTPYLVKEGFLKEVDLYCQIEFTNIGVVGRFDYDKKEPIPIQRTLF